jgi:HSP20 family molecular chaperone IbpA
LIVHNYFNLQTVAEVERVIETELKQLFNAKKNPLGYWLSNNFKHFVIANSNSAAGEAYNKKTIENIQIMIQSANAKRNPDVLKRIIKEVEGLLSKVLVEKKPDTPSNSKDDSQKPQTWLSRVIRTMWGKDKKEVAVSNKQQVKVKLEVKHADVEPMKNLWFICPTEPLPDNIILSNDLRFNHDGSVYIDFSSQFVPDLNIVRLNDKGDVGIHIECPSCQQVTVTQQGMTSILVRGEKIAEPQEKHYLNTRRVGKFEVEISLDGLEKDLTLNIGSLKTDFTDGILRITIPNNKSKFIMIIDEL